MAATFTLSGDLATIVGANIDPNAVQVYVEASEPAITDTTAHVTRLGSVQATVNSDGTWTAPGLIATNATDIVPAPVAGQSFKYRVLIRYRDARTSTVKNLLTGWFDLTANLKFDAIDERQLTQISDDLADDVLAEIQASLTAALTQVATSTSAATSAASAAATSATTANSAKTAAETARAGAEAVGTTNDTVIAGRINTPGSATATALSNSTAAAIKAARTSIFDGVKARLNDGLSVAISYLTDSTGNDPSGEHIGLTAARLATLWPTHRVEFYGYDNSTPNNYTGALRVVKQAGPTTQRKVAFQGTANSALFYGASTVSAITGDLDVRAKVSATSWTAAPERVIAAKAGGGGTRSWYWCLSGSNMILYFTTDGTTLIGKSVALSNFTLVDGQPADIRMVLDVDNGASGYDVKFYQSTDSGVTWTQKGATATTAGVIALFSDTVTALNIGARSGGGSGNWVGDIHRVEIRSGIDGAIVAPTLPDLWSPTSSAFDGVFSGDPVIQIWAGAASAWGLSNFLTNAARLIPAVGQELHLMGTSHNEAFRIDAGIWNDWDSLLATARLRAPAAAFGVFNENPETSPTSARQIAAHRDRCRQIGVYAKARGYEFYDAYTPLAAAGAGSTISDGIHPSASGSQLWAQTILDRWGIGA